MTRNPQSCDPKSLQKREVPERLDLFRFIRRTSTAPLLAVGSQMMGVVQLLLMLMRHGATQATDAYLYLFNLGTLPNQIIAVGVLYPLLLSSARISRRKVRFTRILLPLLAAIFVLAGAAWLQLNGRIDKGTAVVAIMCLVNSILQAGIWPLAVAAEAGGDARWMAGVALPANVLACIWLLPAWPGSAAQVIAMIVGLVMGNATLLAVMWQQGVGASVLRSLPESGNGSAGASWWFAGKSAVGYGGLALMQTITLTLPPSALTIVAVPTKIVAGVSGVLINTVLPRFVHQRSQSWADGARFLRFVWVGLMPVFGGACVAIALLQPQWLLVTVVVGLWMYASAGSAAAQRMAFRFLPASASSVTLVALPVIVVGTWITASVGRLTIANLLCAYGLIDAVSATAWFTALKLKGFALLMAVISGALMFLWGAVAWWSP